MNVRRSLESRIRGWLPNEPILPSHATPSQTEPSKARSIFLNGAVGFLVLVGLLYTIFSLSNSWIKIWLIAIPLVAGVLWFISRGKLKSALKVTLVAVMIFSISFTAVEGYLFWNGGYPPTYASTQPKVSLSMQTMLNASLAQIVRDIKQTPTFSLLKLEYGDNIAFQSMQLEPVSGGYSIIRVDFASVDNNAYFHFYSSDGHQYIVQPMTHSGELMSEQYPSSQTTETTFKQIDSLGLNWFYNKALEVAQNITANLPTVDSVDITVFFGEGLGSYQGITLQLIGYHQNLLPNGITDSQSVLISGFEPNGTLIYMSKPSLRDVQ